jgi:translation initiation factor 1
LCVCGAIDREGQKIKVYSEKRKFRKIITIVEGITDKGKEVSSQLKSKLACGGTYKDGKIELQGDHKNKLKDILVKLGYSADKIEVN